MKAHSLIAILGALSLSSTAFAARHGIYPTLQQRELDRILKLDSAPAAKQQLLYFGGPVIANAKVYSVIWGNKVKPTTQKQIGDFLANLVDSTQVDFLKQYNTDIKATDGRDGTNQKIGRGSYGGQFIIQPAFTGSAIDDKDIQAELDHQIDIKALPAADANTLYMIYFPPGASLSIEGMHSCQEFCAYHEGFVSKAHGNVYYGVMPDIGGACSFGCGFHAAFDTLTIVSSHELMEAVTDPFPTPADKPAYPQAWNTSDGMEIGDICAQGPSPARLTTKGQTYLIQSEFDNASGACTKDNYQSP